MTVRTPSRTPTRARAKDAWHFAFLSELAKSCNVSRAAEVAGVGRQTAYDHRGMFEDFSAAWDDAIEQATDALEFEARRRAMEGTEKPIVSQGEIIATVREYSDQLMMALLKAHRPDKYRDRRDVSLTGAGGGPVEHVVSVVIDLGDDSRMRDAGTDDDG